MIEVTYDVLTNEDTLFANDMNMILISSEIESNEIHKILIKIVNNIFTEQSFVFKASGLPGNINDIMSETEWQNIHYHQGDSKKFFIKKYPEFITTIDKTQLSKVLVDCWSNAIYERRYVYIADEKNTEKLFEVLKQHKYSNDKSVEKSLRYVNAIIENVPECDKDSFALIIKNSLNNKIIDLLKSHKTGDA